jgi:hypothetical protein
MQYFRLTQDPDYLNAPIIANAIDQIDRRYTVPKQAHKIAEVTIFSLQGKEKPDFIDVLLRQFFLVSSSLKETITLYRPKLSFKMVLLAHPVQKEQKTYYLPLLEPIECLSEESIMTPDKSKIKKLVLKHSIIQRETIFRVQHSHETIIIARLDAAESILRRNFRGTRLSTVELA